MLAKIESEHEIYIKELFELGLNNYQILTRVVNNKFKQKYSAYGIKKCLNIKEPKYKRKYPTHCGKSYKKEINQ